MKYIEDVELSELIKSQASNYAAPAHLHSRIKLTLENHSNPQKAFWRNGWLAWQQWTGLGIAFACGALMSVSVIHFFANHDQHELIASQVINGHVRSLMVAHLSDVASTDLNTVKPWFTGKLDYSPPIADLALEGFPLIGGRLDYMDERPVAALVYRHHSHAINVFVWPARNQATRNIAAITKKGYNAAIWQGNGMQYWAVSDLNAADLKKFAELMRVRKLTQS